MLVCIPGVTLSYAEAIVSQYPTFSSFYTKLMETAENSRSKFLVGVEVEGGRSIGAVVSKRIVEAILDDNPTTRVM
jgi:hypothetical protein